MTVAILKFAHIAGTAIAFLQFGDGSIYRIEPFLDDDWIELMRHHLAPGTYFNLIVRKRENFTSVKLAAWPDHMGSDHAWLVHYYTPRFP